MRWKPLLIGVVIGALAGLFMGKSQTTGSNPMGITGGFARPFQYKVDPGKGVRGG
jgi:hypothetical protein